MIRNGIAGRSRGSPLPVRIGTNWMWWPDFGPSVGSGCGPGALRATRRQLTPANAHRWTDPDGRTWRIRIEQSQALRGTKNRQRARYVMAWVAGLEMKFNIPLDGEVDLAALTDEQLEEIQVSRKWPA